MVTTLSIVLAVLVVLNVWLLISTTRREKRKADALQEKIEEYCEFKEAHEVELQGARHRVTEAIAEMTKIKSNYDKLLKEHESLYKEYKSVMNAMTADEAQKAKVDPQLIGEPKPANEAVEMTATPRKPRIVKKKAKK